VNFPLTARKRDVAQGLDAAKRLRDVPHFEDGRVGHSLLAFSPLAGMAAQVRKRSF
jgi:hypothetical protein